MVQNRDFSIRTNLKKCLENWDSRVFRLRYPDHSRRAEWMDRGHFHYTPELFFQFHGSCVFGFSDEEILLSEGEFLLIPSYCSHMETVKAPYKLFCNLVILQTYKDTCIHIAGSNKSGIPCIQDMNHLKIPVADISSRLDKILNSHRTKDSIGIKRAESSLYILLHDVYKTLDQTPMEYHSPHPVVNRCLSLLHFQLSEPLLSVKFLSGQLSLNPDYLSCLFKQHTGSTLSEYINVQRMKLAEYLLCYSDLNSGEIAWACGFRNPGYFNRVFRKHYSGTPLEIRRDFLQSRLQ